MERLQRKLAGSGGSGSPEWRMVQDPVISKATIPEVAIQSIVHGGITALFYWLFGFEAAVLLALVVGVALVSMNILSSGVSSNVHLAEIRDFLYASRKSEDGSDPDGSADAPTR